MINPYPGVPLNSTIKLNLLPVAMRDIKGQIKNDFRILFLFSNSSNMFNNIFSKRRNYSKVLHKFPTHSKRKPTMGQIQARLFAINKICAVESKSVSHQLPENRQTQNKLIKIDLDQGSSPENKGNLPNTSHNKQNLLSWNPSYDYFSTKSNYADLLSDNLEFLFQNMRRCDRYMSTKDLFSLNPRFNYFKIMFEDNRNSTLTYANLLIDSLDLWFADIKRYHKHLLTLLLCRKYNRAFGGIDKYIIRHYIGPQSFDVPYLTKHNFLDSHKIISQRYFNRAYQVTFALMNCWPITSVCTQYLCCRQQHRYRMKYRLIDTLDCQNIFKYLWYRRVSCRLKPFEKLLNS